MIGSDFGLPLQASGPIESSLQTSASSMALNAKRMELSIQNLVNQRTLDYSRKLAVVSSVPEGFSDAATADIVEIVPDTTPKEKYYEPWHPNADQDGYVTYSNVSPEIEMINFRQAQRNYEMSVRAYAETKKMWMESLSILR